MACFVLLRDHDKVLRAHALVGVLPDLCASEEVMGREEAHDLLGLRWCAAWDISWKNN